MVDKNEKKEESEQVVSTYTIWSMANAFASLGEWDRHSQFAQAVYQELYSKCLEQGLDMNIVMPMIFSIDSELAKDETASVQDKEVVKSEGVTSVSKD